MKLRKYLHILLKIDNPLRIIIFDNIQIIKMFIFIFLKSYSYDIFS